MMRASERSDAGERQDLRARNQTAPIDITDVLYEWVSARARRLAGARALAGFVCEVASRGSGDRDDQGECRCYLTGADESEWCEPCQRRNKLWPGLVMLKAAERRAFRRLERAAMRLKRVEDAGATPLGMGATGSAHDSSSSSEIRR